MCATRPDRLVSLFAVGDIYFNRKEETAPYRDMLPLMQRADIRFCNLEAPVALPRDPLPDRPYPLRSPPENLGLLAQGKFDAIAIAHNHLMDFGVPGMRETLKYLSDLRQPFTGAGETLAEAMRPIIVESHGMTFGFIAMACAFPSASGAREDAPGIAGLHIDTRYEPLPGLADEHPGIAPRIVTEPDKAGLARLCEAVRLLKQNADHVIVSFHWGVPGQTAVLDYQRTIAHAVIDAGAVLILGHHAHVLQGVERYANGLIYYGLSHVIFDMPGILSGFGFDAETAAAEIHFSEDGIADAFVHPFMMDEGESARTPAKDERERIGKLLTELSRPLGTELAYDAGRSAWRIAKRESVARRA